MQWNASHTVSQTLRLHIPYWREYSLTLFFFTWNLSRYSGWCFTRVRGLPTLIPKLNIAHNTLFLSWFCSCLCVFMTQDIFYVKQPISLHLKIYLKKSVFRLLYHVDNWHFLCFRLTNAHVTCPNFEMGLYLIITNYEICSKLRGGTLLKGGIILASVQLLLYRV